MLQNAFSSRTENQTQKRDDRHLNEPQKAAEEPKLKWRRWRYYVGHMQYEQLNLITRTEVCRRGVYCMRCLGGRGWRGDGRLFLSGCLRFIGWEMPVPRPLLCWTKAMIPDSTQTATSAGYKLQPNYWLIQVKTFVCCECVLISDAAWMKEDGWKAISFNKLLLSALQPFADSGEAACREGVLGPISLLFVADFRIKIPPILNPRFLPLFCFHS